MACGKVELTHRHEQLGGFVTNGRAGAVRGSATLTVRAASAARAARCQSLFVSDTEPPQQRVYAFAVSQEGRA